MIKVKLLFPYNWPLIKQSSASVGRWGEYQFYLNDDQEDYDALVVFNIMSNKIDKTVCFKKKTIFIATEPFNVQQYHKRFMDQFSVVLTSQKEIKHSNKLIQHTGAPWFVNKSYDELKEMKPFTKNKKISIITSNKLITEGHKKRFEFVMKIKDYFEDEIDLFGRGINDFEDKWDVLAPYKYNICIENGSHKDYFTEKINDCFLAYTFPIYHGCTNLENYYNKDSFAQIDINNFEDSLRGIERILNDEDHYARHLDSIEDSRLKYLETYNIFPLLVDILDKIDTTDEKKVEVIIKNKFFDFLTLKEKIEHKISQKFWK